MRSALTTLALAAALLGSGCLHITTKVPGVLDLRSDASEVPAAPVASAAPAAGADKDKDKAKPAGAGARDGFDAWFQGDGVTAAASGVTIDDRKWWAIGLVPIANESATEEIQAAMGDGVLRNVTIGEQETLFDIGLVACGEPIVSVCTFGIGSLVGLVLPPFDFKMTGIHGKLTAAAGEPTPPTTTPGE